MKHAAETLAYYLAFVVVGMTTASFGPGIPGFAAATGSTLAQVGALFVFHRIGYITGSLGGAKLVDTFRGNRDTGPVLFVAAAGPDAGSPAATAARAAQ